MTLGERCDEIVRLIDETLDDYALSVQAMGPRPSRAAEAAPVEPPAANRHKSPKSRRARYFGAKANISSTCSQLIKFSNQASRYFGRRLR